MSVIDDSKLVLSVCTRSLLDPVDNGGSRRDNGGSILVSTLGQ